MVGIPLGLVLHQPDPGQRALQGGGAGNKGCERRGGHDGRMRQRRQLAPVPRGRRVGRRAQLLAQHGAQGGFQARRHGERVHHGRPTLAVLDAQAPRPARSSRRRPWRRWRRPCRRAAGPGPACSAAANARARSAASCRSCARCQPAARLRWRLRAAAANVPPRSARPARPAPGHAPRGFAAAWPASRLARPSASACACASACPRVASARPHARSAAGRRLRLGLLGRCPRCRSLRLCGDPCGRMRPDRPRAGACPRRPAAPPRRPGIGADLLGVLQVPCHLGLAGRRRPPRASRVRAASASTCSRTTRWRSSAVRTVASVARSGPTAASHSAALAAAARTASLVAAPDGQA